MNLRDLEYVVAIAEHGHFAQAADACHVSQSTLSIQLKKLEESLGVTLFERTNRKVMLTPVGAQVRNVAAAMLRDAQRIGQIAAESRNPLSGPCAIGAFPTLAPYLFPRLVPLLEQKLPGLKPLFIEEKTDKLVEMLRSGEVECALLAMPIETPDLVSAELYFEPFYLAVPAAHALVRKKTIKPDDIREETILLLDEGHCLRGQSLEFCARLGKGETSTYRATSLETLRSMISAGAGVTLIPQLALMQETDNITYIPFASPAPGRLLGLFWRHTSPRKRLFQTLTGVLKEACSRV